MQLYPVAGAKIYIGPAGTVPDDDVDASDFASITWTEIKGWQTMGSVGDTATLITEAVISAKRDLKAKGTRNAGSMQNNFIILPTDPGQIALIAAEATEHNYPFKIEFDDEPAGSAPTPTIKYFYGIVMSANEQGGGANTARLLQGNIEVNSNVVTVAPTAGP